MFKGTGDNARAVEKTFKENHQRPSLKCLPELLLLYVLPFYVTSKSFSSVNFQLYMKTASNVTIARVTMARVTNMIII